MTSIEDIFVKFYRENNVSARTEFGKGRIYFFRDEEYSKENLMKTVDFAGFSDGLCKNPNKYSAKTKGISNPISIVGDILNVLGINEGIEMDESMNEVFGHDFVRYNDQYKLGQSLR